MSEKANASAAAPDAKPANPTVASGALLPVDETVEDPAPRYEDNEVLPAYSDSISPVADDTRSVRSATVGRAPSVVSNGNNVKGNIGGGITKTESAAVPATGAIRLSTTTGRSGFLGKSLNMAANLIGAEGWWASSVDQECLKAARILHSFTKLDKTSEPPQSNGPMHPTGLTKRSMVKIPPEVLRNCAGLAIFNVLRAGGWHGSLSGGSGVVIARRADGTWSPPSAFLVSSLGAGIVAGLEVYDTVCVLNTQAQVDSFASSRFALGGSGSIAVGPVGSGTAVQAAVRKTGRPMWSYIKSRGLFFGVQIDGTVIVGRGDANAAFYGEPGITAAKILREDVAWPVGAKPLFDVLMAMDSQTQAAPAGAEEHATQQAAVSENPSAPLLVKRYSDIKQATPAPLSDNDNRDQRSDIYGDSVADEKERLAKSGF